MLTEQQESIFFCFNMHLPSRLNVEIQKNKVRLNDAQQLLLDGTLDQIIIKK